MNSTTKIKVEAEKLKVAQAQVEAEQTKLNSLKNDVALAAQELNDIRSLKTRLEKELQEFKLEEVANKNDFLDQTKEAKRQLKEVEKTVKERKKYLEEQELTINTVVENYNTRLVEMNAGIATIERQKDDALRELAEYNQQEKESKEEVGKIQSRLNQLQAFYDEQVAKFKIEIRELQSEKERADMNRQHALDEAAKVLKVLSEKEKQLQLREQVLEEREAKQAEEEDYLRRKKAIIRK